jgi:hypothetical protein
MKMTVFWVVTPYSWWKFTDVSVCLAIAPVIEAGSTYETSVNVYQTIRRNNPEDSHLHRKIISEFSTLLN